MERARASLQQALEREMTRKEFLLLLGFGVLVVMRLEPLLRNLGVTKPRTLTTTVSSNADNYGSVPKGTLPTNRANKF